MTISELQNDSLTAPISRVREDFRFTKTSKGRRLASHADPIEKISFFIHAGGTDNGRTYHCFFIYRHAAIWITVITYTAYQGIIQLMQSTPYSAYQRIAIA